MSKKLDTIKKKREELKKKQEEIDKKIKELEDEEEQKIKEIELAEKIKEEKHREYIRKKRILSLHADVDKKLMKNILKSISDIQNEALFSFKKKSIQYIGVDPAHVAIYKFKIPSKTIGEYKVKKTTEIGIDVEKLTGILKRRKRGTKNIVLDRYKKHNSLYVSWKSNGSDTLFKRKCPLVNPDGLPKPKVPTLDLHAEFDISIGELLEFLKEAGDVADHFSITTSKAGVMFEAVDDEDVARLGIPANGTKYKHCRSMFSLDYFTNAIKSMNRFFKDVNMKMGTDNPIEIRGKNKDGIKMMAMLAPRIQGE